MTIGQPRASTKQAESDEIERLTAEYLRKGGKIQREEVTESKFVDTWRNYAAAAMEGVR